MPDPVVETPKEIDFGALVEELEGVEPEVVAEEGAEPAAVEEEVVAEPEVVATEDEDDHEKFVASQGDKPISQKAFLERLGREKKKREELNGRYTTAQAEIEGLRKSQPMTASDVQRFQALSGVFENLDKSAKEMPWVTDMLLALGRGQKPDWAKVQEGMAAYIATVPKGDPILYQQQQELRQQVEELQNERLGNAAVAHIQNEDVEITKILGDKSDPVASQLWAILNEQAKHAFDAMNPKSFKDGPNRVQMAKRLIAAFDQRHQQKLKAQIPPPNRPKAGLEAGKGGAAGAPAANVKKPPMDIHSKEFEEFYLKGLT